MELRYLQPALKTARDMPQRKGYFGVILLPVAMLILLPAPTGAGVVPAHFWAGADGLRFFHCGCRFTDHVAGLPFVRRCGGGAGLGFAAAERAGALVQRFLRHI